jgi:hypothetical protein
VYRAEPPDEWRDPSQLAHGDQTRSWSTSRRPARRWVRLHEHPGGTNIKLERISLTEAPQVTNLWFRVVSRDLPHRLTRDG